MSDSLSELTALVHDGFRRVLGDVSRARSEVAGVRGEVRSLVERVEVVEHHLFGSGPPPPPDAGAARLVARVSESEADADAMQGRLLALEAECASAKRAAEDARRAAEETAAINRQQSRAMGLARPEASSAAKFSRFLLSREGAKFLVALATLIGVLSAASRGAPPPPAPAVQGAP